jgi:hypothetical protein
MAHAGHRTSLRESKTGAVAYRDWLAMSIQPASARRVESPRHGCRRPLFRSVTGDEERLQLAIIGINLFVLMLLN